MSQSRESLKAVFDVARARAKAEPSAETLKAAQDAWAAYDAAGPKQKRAGFGSRVGQRQQAARRAEQAERNARAADRRWR